MYYALLSIVFFCLKGEKIMEEKQLYLQKSGDGYVFCLEPFDVRIMSDDTFLFKEAAVVVLYPDGFIDAIRTSGGIHHNYYYEELYKRSERFKESIDKLGFVIDFEPDESTYKLDCLLSSLGISTIHNVDINRIPYRLEYLEPFCPLFYTFKAENTTLESDENFQVIYDNYPENCIVKNQYSTAMGKYERENKDEIRKI